MHTKTAGERPHRHHSYNGHEHVRSNGTGSRALGIFKSKSNSQFDFRKKAVAISRNELSQMDHSGSEVLSVSDSYSISKSETSENYNTNTQGWDSVEISDSELQKATEFEAIRVNANNFHTSNIHSFCNEGDKDSKELFNVISGIEERKNRYNVLVSQLSTTSSTCSTSSGEQNQTVIGSYNGGEGKWNGNNSETNGGHSPTCDLPLSVTKISRNSSANSLAVTEPNNKQSLKHLSASAPAIRTDIGKGSDKGDLFMAPSSSKSRQKKFHRHFKTVPPEEKVLDYYSCALVGDILLQGFLYISENYFAFYSNVFGYVTKLLIPVCTVESITKEKTAKIFPNAVAVRTQTEKHVFASLISRDATHKLMYKVWMHGTNQSPLDAIIIPKHSDDGSADLEIPDESSGDSGSGNDSALEPSSCSPSPQSTPGIEKLLHAKLIPINNNNVIAHLSQCHPAQLDDANVLHAMRNDLHSRPHDPISKLANGQIYLRGTHRTSLVSSHENNIRSFLKNDPRGKSDVNGVSGSTKTPSLLILATALLVILFLSAALLLVRISNLQQKLTETPNMPNSEQFYQDLLTWQNRLHSNSADEIHQFIDTNLQQIVRVRESLEALSTLFMNGQHNSMMGDHSSSPHSHLANTDR